MGAYFFTHKLPSIIAERAKEGRHDTHLVFEGSGIFAEYFKDEHMARKLFEKRAWNEHFHGDGWRFDTSVAKMASGDDSKVQSSEKIMRSLEEAFAFHSTSFQTVNAVAGGLPNVPAYLAGHPVNMRVRKRVTSQMAPITIIIDTSSSASIAASTMEKRGIAILALVRILAACRPVTLYIGAVLCHPALDNDYNAAWVRVETSPLDLARSAHMLTHQSVSRGLLYGVICSELHPDHGGGSWAFGTAELERSTAVKNLTRIFGGEIVFVPAAHGNDKLSTDPSAWLKEMIARYGQPNTDEQEAAA